MSVTFEVLLLVGRGHGELTNLASPSGRTDLILLLSLKLRAGGLTSLGIPPSTGLLRVGLWRVGLWRLVLLAPRAAPGGMLLPISRIHCNMTLCTCPTGLRMVAPVVVHNRDILCT